MSYNFYKVLHLTGIFMLFISIGAAVVRVQVGEAAANFKKFVGIMNGVGLLLIFVAGFGLMARLGIAFDGWIFIKFGIWVVFGGLLVALNRKPGLAQTVTIAAVLLGMLAAYVAITKPF